MTNENTLFVKDFWVLFHRHLRSAMARFGNLLGIAYQIHDDLIERSNEDRLFNLLVMKNDHSKEFIQRMEDLCLSYSTRAKSELLNIQSDFRSLLEKTVDRQTSEKEAYRCNIRYG